MDQNQTPEEVKAPEQETSPAVSAPVPEYLPAESVLPSVAVPAAKKSGKKKVVFIVLGAVACALIAAFLAVYFTVIRPESIISKAKAAIEAKDYTECQRLLDSIPDYKKTPAARVELAMARARTYFENGDLDQAESVLRTLDSTDEVAALLNEITYQRAKAAIENGDFAKAREYLNKIPKADDPLQLREKIKYNDALAAIDAGDYETAYACFSELGEFEDAATQKEIVYYEALLLNFLLKVQPQLRDPASLRLTKAWITGFGDGGEVDIAVMITGTNGFGGTVSSYFFYVDVYGAIRDNKLKPYGISTGDYNNPSDYYDMLTVLVVEGIKKGTQVFEDFDVARINRLLENNVTFKVGLEFAAVESEN